MIGHFTSGIPKSELRDILSSNAETITEGEYYRPLSEEDIEARRRLYADTCIRIKDLDSKKKLAVEHFKGKMKPLNEANSITLDEIKTKQVKCDGVLYEVPNYDDEVMETYNEEGDFISHRKMRPDEKNGGTNVFTLPAIAK